MTDVFLFKMEAEERIGLSYTWDRGIQKKIKNIRGRKFEGKHWTVPVEQYPTLVEIFGDRLGFQDDIPGWYEQYRTRVRIVVEGNVCTLGSPPDDFVKQAIRSLCTFKPKNARYIIQAVRRQRGNPNIRFTPEVSRFRYNQFPVGILDEVVDKISDHALEVKIEDLRAEPERIVLDAPPISLRDYQLAGVEEMMVRCYCILHMAPGLGKTRVGAETIRRRSVKSLFLVHTVDLLEQAKEVLEEHLEIDVGKIGDQERKFEDITVGTVQTFYSILNKEPKDYSQDDRKALDILRDYPLLMLDESHHGSADIFEKVMMFSQARYRYGLTGTLTREAGDEVLYRCQLGPPIGNYTLKWGVENKWLAPPVFVFYRYPRTTFRSHSFDVAYDEGIVHNTPRNTAIKELALRNAKKGDTVLILVDHIDHGNILQEMISAEEDRTVFVQGADRSDYRKAVRRFMAKGELKVVVATRIFDEGVDMPSIDNLIKAVGGKSYSRDVQRIGRSLRLCEGKERAFIIDFVDEGRYLKEHSKIRMGVVRSEGFEPSIMDWKP